MFACHFLELQYVASRPPVKATLWLSALGLDGARTVMRAEFTVTRKWQAMSGKCDPMMRLPLVGTDYSADYDQALRNCT